MVRLAINGYGRIGRIAHRVILERFSSQIEIAAINAGSSTDLKGWMYLLKYDSAYGTLHNHSVSCRRPEVSESAAGGQDPRFKALLGYMVVDGKDIPIYSQKDPSLLPWRQLEIDVVVESTGVFRTEEQLKSHLTAGARSVVLSAPPDKGGVPTYVLSVNGKDYKGESVISNASCTTNCIAPVAKVLVDNFGVQKAIMTTVHGYTLDQRLIDGGHKDYRRARAAGQHIIPTSTGASKSAASAVPELKGLFGGLALRVPVPVGSLSDCTFLLKRETTAEEINDVFRRESQSPNYKGILGVTDDPLVSGDIVGSPYSCIVDLSLTQVVGGDMVQIIAWYDNEYGYANRLVEEALMVAAR